MKKNIPGCILSVFIVACIGCKPEKKAAIEQKPPERRQVQPTEETLSASECSKLISKLDVGIRGVGTADNKELKDGFVSASWDSISGGFICLGKGVVNPKLPSTVRSEAQQKAAQLTAERWALYLKMWRDGEYVSRESGISGEIMYSRELCRRNDGDTLFLLLQVPLGSIVVGRPDVN